jgi:hypothetical protein
MLEDYAVNYYECNNCTEMWSTSARASNKLQRQVLYRSYGIHATEVGSQLHTNKRSQIYYRLGLLSLTFALQDLS